MLRILILLALGLGGCAHYRGVSAGFRTGPDYAAAARGPAHVAYAPRSEFEVSWPVRDVRINRGFSAPRQGRPHQGVDLGGSRGTPILAAHEGRVVYVGSQFRGFGKMVLVEYDRHWATLYAHLDRIDVKEGQILSAGESLGRMGRTGRASGVHLHFELMRDKQPVDPLPYLARPGRVARH